MNLYNAQTQQTELFQPDSNEVAFFVGNISPDKATRLDHALYYCVADVLVRYMVEIKGWRVKHGQNSIPDDAFVIEDMQSLNIRPPDYFSPPANAHPPVTAVDLLLTSEKPPSQTGNSLPAAKLRLDTAVFAHEGEGDKNPQAPGTLLLRDLLQTHSPDVLRIYLAQHHYRESWTHDEAMLEKAALSAEKLRAAMHAVSTGQQPINIAPAQKRFTAVMDNDLDTVRGVATLLNLADEILFRAPNGYLIDDAQATLQQMATVFGLRLNSETAEDQVITGWNHYQQQLEENQT